MNVELPFNSVKECIEAGMAKKIETPEGVDLPAECADLDCHGVTETAWIWNSTVFVITGGRMIARPATMWFPLCAEHAPLQEVPDLPEEGEGEQTDTPLDAKGLIGIVGDDNAAD
jgi:hypothetical protein